MKHEIALENAHRLINSGQLVLVSSCAEEKRNVLAVAWSSPVSRKPAIIAASIARTHYSCTLIKKSKEFVINVPEASLLDAVLYCGSHSGYDVDKFAQTKLTPCAAHRLSQAPLIEQCIGHLECRVKNEEEIGDHCLFIAEVVYACASQAFGDVWDISKAKLIYHLGGKFFATAERLLSA